MDSIVLWLLLGAVLGAGVGRFRKPGSLKGLSLAGWKQGAIAGAIVALVLYTTSGDGLSFTMNRSTANVKHIADNEFDSEVAKASLPVVVEYYATWCGPCRELAPTVDSLAKQYSGKVKFVKVNVDESPGLSQKFQVEALPTLLFFKAGQLTDASVGLVAKTVLARQIDVWLQTKAPAAASRPGLLPAPPFLTGFY